MIVQIIGQVTGLDRKTVVKKFNDSEEYLKSKGYLVINPVKMVDEKMPWEQAMKTCINTLINIADAVFIQPDWYNSEGAKLEYMVATALKLKEIRQ